MYYQLLMPKATRSPYPELGVNNPVVLFLLGEKPAAYELEHIWWLHNGYHRPLAKIRRSMTMGDIILLNGQAWVAGLEGFVRLTGNDIPQSVQHFLAQ